MPALIYLGAEHGASKQEALSLLWKDINFDYKGVGLIKLFRSKNTHKRTELLMPRTREALPCLEGSPFLDAKEETHPYY